MLKKFISLLYAKYHLKKILSPYKNPKLSQEATLLNLIKTAANTNFGENHNFSSIKNYLDFKVQVPITTYEDIKPYINKIKQGKKDILWPGLPLYFCKTSGTTSGSKYIPISKEGLNHQLKTAKNALLFYIAKTKKTAFINGKMIFLQGSPKLDYSLAVPCGRLSGIVAHHIPFYLKKNRLPSFETNCLEDWTKKISGIIEETSSKNMSLISGIPPWVVDYFEKLIDSTKKETIKSIFPNLSLLVYGGVDYKPYQKKINSLIGDTIDTIELYPASEGFIAYQHQQGLDGMLLNLDGSIFYEFIPVEEFYSTTRQRLSIKEVKVNASYAIVLNTNSGLWGYIIGDTVKFLTLNPPVIKVTGRVSQYISAFGEHVILEEIEHCIAILKEQYQLAINEFHVAPFVAENKNEPSRYHWFLEVEENPTNTATISETLDTALMKKNSYYKDLRDGEMLSLPKIILLKKGLFNTLLKQEGKFGGQNKPPKIANNFNFAKKLSQLSL